MQKNTLAAIIFALSLFFIFVLVLPQYDIIKAAKGIIGPSQVLLGERKTFLNNVLELDKQAKSRQADIEKIKTFLPEHKQIDEIVSSIQKIAEQSGQQLVGLTTSEVLLVTNLDYKKVFIGVDIVGTYPAFVNFLKLLEQNLRIYDVFEITAASSTTIPGSVNFAIKINAYYLK
ncbi:MAG: type 4a pilus biogenesis protein PilO [Candidatus Yanofskybacteria bacterium]|nr:type 4a pilus biogenesis protein PilO [Candidatus Yanofskybacteria bacterium]